MNRFTMIFVRTLPDRSVLASTSAASLAMRWTCTVKVFAGRQIRQREAVLYGNKAGITMARHARSIAVETNPL